MSNDIAKTEIVGLRLKPQYLEKIDERRASTGATRQEVIKEILKDELF